MRSDLELRRRILIFGAGVLLTVLSLPAAAGEAVDQDPSARQVQTTLNDLQRWLSRSRHAEGWNNYLQTASLETELAKGNAADPAEVEEILARYRSEAAGLDRPRFSSVRRALTAWSQQLDVAQATDLTSAAQQAKSHFAGPLEEDVQAAQSLLLGSADALEAYLARSRRHGPGWKTYLDWNRLRAELRKTDPDLAKLNATRQKLAADHGGLEKNQFRSVRHALKRYLDVQLIARNPEGAQSQFETKIEDLATLLKSYGTRATHRDALEVARRLDFLQRLGQSPGLVRRVRSELSHPNLTAYVTADLIQAGADSEISEPITINQDILGTYVSGQGNTTGRLLIALVPDPQRAAFDLNMNGVTQAKTTGRNRGVTVFTESTTQLRATKRLTFDPTGLTAGPTDTWASTSTRINGLATRRGNRLVERIAWNQVYQRKGSSEREAARHARGKLRQRIDQDADERLADANSRYQLEFRFPLLRRDAFPSVFDVSTTDQQVQLTLLEAAADQLGAPAAPAPAPAGSDMAVRAHESLINNFAAVFLGGVTLASENIPDYVVQQLETLIPREGGRLEIAKENEDMLKFLNKRRDKVKQRREKEGRALPVEPTKSEDDWWAITLADSNPVTVEFREGHVKFIIRGTRFLGPQNDDARNRARMNIWGDYTVEKDQHGGLLLTLQKWDVTPTAVEETGKGGGQAPALREKLRKRMSEILEGPDGVNKIVEVFPLELPGKFGERTGELAYTVAQAADGWITVAWDRVDKSRRTDKQAGAPSPREDTATAPAEPETITE